MNSTTVSPLQLSAEGLVASRFVPHRPALACVALLLATPVAFAAVTTFPVGPNPSASAPVAVAVESSLNRAYAVHRELYADVAVNVGIVTSNRVTALDLATGNVLATIPIGAGINGLYQGIAVDSTRHRVFVTNPDDNTVTVIDATTNTTLATVAVGAQPQGIAVDPDTGLVYVANNGVNRAGTVTLLDATTGTVRGTVAVGAPAIHVAVDRSTHVAYVTLEASPWTVIAIDGAQQAVVGRVELGLLFAASSIAVDPGSRVYVSFSTSKAVAVLDSSGGAAALRESARWLSVGLTPRAVAIDPATRFVYVADSSNNNVLIWNSSGTQLKTLDVLQRPTALCIDGAASRAYVADTSSNSLTVINTSSQAIVGHWPLASAPTGIAYDPVGQRIYVTNFLTDTLAVVNPATKALVATWRTGPSPWALAVDGSLRQVYSLNDGDGTLTTLSTTDGRILKTTTIGRPVRVVTASATSHRVFATAGESLTVLDGNTLAVLATVSVPSRPVGIALDEAGNRLYVASQQSGTISVINATTFQVVATWRPPLGNVWGLAIDPPRRRLYVAIIKNTVADFGGVEVLNADTGAFVAQIATGAEFVTVNSRTHVVYTTDISGNAIAVIDGDTNTLTSSVAVGASPRDLNVDETTGLVYVANVADGTVSILDATITPTAPVITVQPQGRTASAGTSVTFSVTAAGTAPLAYQWRKDGVNIADATGATLSLPNVQAGDAGAYSVVVSNSVGSVMSSTATLVLENPSRIVNLSIRSTAGTGAQTLIVGFVVSGAGKSLLVRGIGPALRTFGVTDALADPLVAIYMGNTAVATNDDWSAAGNATQVATTASQLGAFSLGAGSRDAALLTTLDAGSYTAQTTGVGNATGVALVELYDANPAATSRLVNVSARTRVGTGESILIAGFTIGGSGKKTVLLRAIGPALAGFGVTGVLLDPQLQLYRTGASAAIATNDDWGNTTALRNAFTQAGSFPLGATSFDAALLVTLDPGSYTTQVSGVDGATGVALIELYEMN
ncbi:MAG: immunoglobulin domain-containing protein [Opitutaceae bacterium]|nr:immunoglobulin domain-containing protein [Opitutaceae bacterium]